MLQYFLFVFVCLLIQLHIVTLSHISICEQQAEKFPVVDLVSVNNSWQSSSILREGCFNTKRPNSSDDAFVATWFHGEKYEWILFKLRSSVELTAVIITAPTDNIYYYAKNISIYITNNPSLNINFTNHCNAGDYTDFNEQDWTYCGTSNISKNGQSHKIVCNTSITAKYILLRKYVWNSVFNAYLNIVNLKFYGKIICNYYLEIEDENKLTDGSILTVFIKSHGDANMTTETCHATLTNTTVIQLINNNGKFQHLISISWNKANITCTAKIAGKLVTVYKTISVYAKPTLNITIDTKNLTNVKLPVKGKLHVYNYHLYPYANIQCFIQTDLDTKNITLTDNKMDKNLNMSGVNGIFLSVYTASFEIDDIKLNNSNIYINCIFNNILNSCLYFKLTTETTTTEITTTEITTTEITTTEITTTEIQNNNKNNHLEFIITGVSLVIVVVVVVVVVILIIKFLKPFQHKTNKNPIYVAREESIYENDSEDFIVTNEKNKKTTTPKFTNNNSTKNIEQEDDVYENDDEELTRIKLHVPKKCANNTKLECSYINKKTVDVDDDYLVPND